VGLFSSIFDLFGSSSIDDSTSISAPTDFGVNPTTGLPMISSSIDAGGHVFCETPSVFDSSSSFSSFDSSCGNSFDSSSSAFDSFGSSSLFNDCPQGSFHLGRLAA
jgi:hypothetical protein